MPSLTLTFSQDGAIFKPTPVRADWLTEPDSYGTQADLAAFLGQLDEEGFSQSRDDQLLLPWDEVYRLIVSKEHQESLHLLGLPVIETWRPILDSQGSFTDADFSIDLSGWIDPTEKPFAGNTNLEGAVLSARGRSILLPYAAWETIKALVAFHLRPLEDRDPGSNRRSWAKIRRYALTANADISNFLKSTVVLNPERLKIGLRKENFGESKMVEVIPGFEGEPARWLEFFDRFQVQDRYDIPDGEGLTHVLISPETKTVLREIKRMPGRRVAGARAEAFVRNPYAVLGPDAEKVIDPEQFEKARDDAGISFARFVARVSHDENKFPFNVALLIEETIDGEVRCEESRFESTEQLDRFIRKLEGSISNEAQCCFWEGYDLEILGDTPDQLKLLKGALNDWRRPQTFSTSEIFDLSSYSLRIGGFGVEKPYYSPFIARKGTEDSWFPDSVISGIIYTPEGSDESMAISLTEEMLGKFQEELFKAKNEHRPSFIFPGCPKPVEVDQAEEMLRFLTEAHKDISIGTFDSKEKLAGKKSIERKGLVIKPNADKLDYEERRGALTLPEGTVPRLPKTLKPTIKLKDYQLYGVMWLQNLWDLSPSNCRGALLADDMGLGKTVQILTFIANCLEENPLSDPFLVVAPVSLLENWKEEIEKFFQAGAIPILTLYGTELSEKRLSRDAIQAELANVGVTRLLVRDWLGNAKVVLTTYETLRDLEFSLARQKWSAMICDEAQKIKNPNAMVTTAAKKQNARLKIACTGTPVENTLVDLWCLFDFIQPGLLGVHKDFGERYRRPIEAETDEEKDRVIELRALIDPQKLRRTKAEVAKDLPRKIEVEACRKLPISEQQRLHYANAINQFRQRTGGAGIGLQSHLGLLQYLRRLCSDPRAPGHISTDSESLTDIVQHSPKMAWLLLELVSIKTLDEKVIIFCEFRDLQRTLQRAVAERFGFSPDVINGDTSANPVNENNRKKRIKGFQQKPGFGVIILSPLAVGFGVNIQGANHVIHFTRTWNPAKEDQATDRAYRIGQTKDVYVYYPVIVAEDFTTFDAKLDKLLEKKRDLSKDMLNGFGDVSASDFGDLEDVGGGSAFGSEAVTSEEIGSMGPDIFEIFCQVLWNKHGYSRTYRTPKTGDGGVDVVAIKGNTGVLIQCKSSSIDGQELGWEAVRDVVGGTAGYAARHPEIKFSKVATTNQRFNGMARTQANINHVQLFDGGDLEQMLSETPILRTELEQFLFT